MEIYVSKDGAQAGPFPMEEVQRMVDAGKYSLGDSGWHQGLKEWVPLSNILPSTQSSTPPPPPNLDSDHATVFGMEDGEKIDVGAAVKDTFKVFRSKASVFKSLNYGFLIPFSKIFSAQLFRKKAVRWVLFLGLTPLAISQIVEVFDLSYHQTLWLFQTYFCCFWGLYFYSLIQPSKAIWRRAIGYAVFTMFIGIPLLLLTESLPIVSSLNPDDDSGVFVKVFGFIFVVGLCEETCKALPLLIFGLRKHAISSIRDGMFLGFVSGLGFAASEGVLYSFRSGLATDLGYLNAGAQNTELIFRMMSGPILHGAWAGTVGWFIGVASNKTLRWPIVVVGIGFMALLHGLNDIFAANVMHLVIAGISVAIFMAYMIHGEEDLAAETKSTPTAPISEN